MQFKTNQFIISKDYDEDFENFDDDFESDREAKSSKNDTKNKKKLDERKYSSEEDTKHKSKSKSQDDYDFYRDGKVIKPNANVVLPTESVIVSSSKIFFNHDSQDRQRRRAKDLFKTIELDKKNISLLDINPLEMKTVYSSKLSHVRIDLRNYKL